ncbi:hypothetical protein H0H92_004888 [Tricholoma furcatifolium]|nr:hypothetical protein H0H92_004888 [Tricholoma furcatifolium]
MIQQTNPRQPNSARTSLRSTTQDDPEEWGHWHNQKYYSLEVVQHPLRARMCGFGDKDRRPLAPAAVAKMVVRRDDNSIVDIEDVDFSFFLVTVDLWSGDGKNEMNLVLHPSSADRFVPPQATTKTKRRGTSSSTAQPRPSGNQTPTSQSASASSQFRSGDQAGGIASPSVHSQSSNFHGSPFFPSMADPMNFSSPVSYGPSAPDTPTWGYPAQGPLDRNASFPPPVLPSIASFARTASGGSMSSGQDQWQSEQESESLPYRAWPTDAAYQPIDAFQSQIDPALRSGNSDGRDSNWAPERYNHDVNPTPVDGSYSSAGYAQAQGPPPPPYYSSNVIATVQPATPVQPSAPVQPLARQTYTRTLIGPLSANACRLLDEHRKPGIFFLFQDLSVRTEGTFRLRMRLMNIGAPPAPEAGATCVHTDVSPVLAQTFTEPFVVYSAKRFPGVPDTTALSIAFGNQGQKLPLVRPVILHVVEHALTNTRHEAQPTWIEQASTTR